MASPEEMMNEVLTPDQHLARAQRYANTLPTALAAASSLRATNATDVALMDVYLHAAEVHLKLRAALLEPRVTAMRDITHTGLRSSDVGPRGGTPSSKDYPSQMELAGG